MAHQSYLQVYYQAHIALVLYSGVTYQSKHQIIGVALNYTKALHSD